MNDLNIDQLAVVDSPYDKSVLIVAGPGTGKTTIILKRLELILNVPGVTLSNIMLVTYTCNAAEELLKRLNMTISVPNNLLVGTCHSVALKIFKAYRHLLTSKFQQISIIDNNEDFNLLRQLCEKYKNRDSLHYLERILYSIVALCDVYNPLDLERTIHLLLKAKESNTAKNIVTDYFKTLISKDKINFNMLLKITTELVHTNNLITRDSLRLLEYVLVDEFQDIDFLQMSFLKAFISPKVKFNLVGDDDQSIYSFRNIRRINISLQEAARIFNAQIFLMRYNYRSTQAIVSAANHVIVKNTKRVVKEIISTSPIEGSIVLASFKNNLDLHFKLSEKVSAIFRGDPKATVAILSRTNKERLQFDSYLHFFKKSIDLKSNLIIQKLISYLLFLDQFQNEHLLEIINFPARSIGPKRIEILKNRSKLINKQNDSELWEFVKLTENKLYKAFIQDIESLLRLKSLGERIDRILEIFMSKNHKLSKEELDVLVRMIRSSPDIKTFRDNIYQENGGCLKVLTVHGAKGLEFDHVFIPYCMNGRFPVFSLNSSNLEEERRVFYVAITRAKKQLYLSYFNTSESEDKTDRREDREDKKNLSMFVEDIPHHLITRKNNTF